MRAWAIWRGLNNRQVKDCVRRDSNTQPSVPKTVEQNPQESQDAALTDRPPNDLADCLAEIVQQHPDLARLIEAWPDLLAETRAEIVKLVQDHIGTQDGRESP
jgi:predicted ATPase